MKKMDGCYFYACESDVIECKSRSIVFIYEKEGKNRSAFPISICNAKECACKFEKRIMDVDYTLEPDENIPAWIIDVTQ